MRFESYARLAQFALAKDTERIIENIRVCAAEEEAAKKTKNSALLKNLISRYGGYAAIPDLPMIRFLEPRFKLNELILPEAFTQLAESIRKQREKRSLLESHNLEPTSRILCLEHPGTGKTAYAHALATHLKLPLYTVAWSQVIEQFLGATSKLVDKMMDWISANDCVFLLDEVDIILRERDDRHEIGEIKRIVCNLLPRLENMGSRALVLAATNHPQCLDNAVWRRFQEVLEFPDATIEGRNKLFEKFLLKHNLGETAVPNQTIFEQDLNFGEFERLLENALRISLIEETIFIETLNGAILSFYFYD